MNRSQFHHTIRAAGAILGENKLLVIGSQAIHASINRLFPEAAQSIEIDISSLVDEDGSKADLIDGSIGEMSLFQDTFGYYAQGVTPKTAVLPIGWRKRLIPYQHSETNGVTAMCLEPHDLWISKAIAGREKDWGYCNALLKRKLVEVETLIDRLKKIKDIHPDIKSKILTKLEAYS